MDSIVYNRFEIFIFLIRHGRLFLRLRFGA